MQDNVCYSSFNHKSVQKVKELDQNVKVGYLYVDGILSTPEYAYNTGVNALHPSLNNIKYPGV